MTNKSPEQLAYECAYVNMMDDHWWSQAGEAVGAYVRQIETVIGHLHDEERAAQAKYREAADRAVRNKKIADENYDRGTAFKKEADELRAAVSDLKARLVGAETSNQFMRGYIARVQEDDVVREPLVETGAPDGDRSLVPKRKPTKFARPADFGESTARAGVALGDVIDRAPRRKHWVTY